MAIITTPGSDYTIQTELYEGPLDLLLDLITKAELDITRLSLAMVTDQYLAYLDRIQQTTAVEVSGFLVVAAKLIQIKSEAILPRPLEREEGEEDPGESLARQLKLYRSFKHAASWLKSMEERGLHTYIRLATPPVITEELDLGGLTSQDLAEYLKNLYHFEEEAIPITSVVAIPRRTIKKKIQDIIDSLRNTQRLSYRSMLPKGHDRIEAIVLFLALLELVKQQYALAEQEGLFADIHIMATEKTFDNEEITLALDD